MEEQVVAPSEEEVVEDTVEESSDNPSVASTIQETKWDISARTAGWVPKEEWQGDPEDWTDAKEFVRRGELFSKISSQSGEIKELKKAIGGLVEHHQKVKETEFKNALIYLKQQKRTALDEGDHDKVIAVEEAIDTLKEEQKQEDTNDKNGATPAPPTPVFVNWARNNPWYIQDKELRAFADDVGVGYFNRNPGVAEEELYNLVKGRVMKAFPEKFKGQGSKTPSVEGTSTGSNKSDSFKLSSEEERVMKTFVRNGIMTKEQYIKDLKAVKASS